MLLCSGTKIDQPYTKQTAPLNNHQERHKLNVKSVRQERSGHKETRAKMQRERDAAKTHTTISFSAVSLVHGLLT